MWGCERNKTCRAMNEEGWAKLVLLHPFPLLILVLPSPYQCGKVDFGGIPEDAGRRSMCRMPFRCEIPLMLPPGVTQHPWDVFEILWPSTSP